MMSKQLGAWAVVVAAMGLLSGCGGGFFIDTKSSTGSTSATNNYVYAVNPVSNSISAFSITGGALAVISGSPLTLPGGLSGSSIAVSRGNSYVYVGGSQVISSYNIGSTGALTQNTTAAATGTQNSNFISLDTSPDGKWLLALDSTSLTIFEYQINSSTGALTNGIQYTYGANSAGGLVAPRMLRISPTGAYVAVALGTNGTELFSFNSATGALGVTAAGVPLSTGGNDSAVAFDGTPLAAATNLFIGRTGLTSGASQILSYAISGSGLLSGTGNAITSGSAPYGLLVERASSYLYAANRGDATVSGYSFAPSTVSTTTPPAALAGSPYAAGSGGVLALVEDKTGAYLVAAGATGGSGKDLTLYTFGVVSPGVLSPVATASTSANGVTALAATH